MSALPAPPSPELLYLLAGDAEDLLAACEKRNLMIDGAAGEEIDEVVRETLRLPPEVAEKIGQMMQ